MKLVPIRADSRPRIAPCDVGGWRMTHPTADTKSIMATRADRRCFSSHTMSRLLTRRISCSFLMAAGSCKPVTTRPSRQRRGCTGILRTHFADSFCQTTHRFLQSRHGSTSPALSQLGDTPTVMDFIVRAKRKWEAGPADGSHPAWSRDRMFALGTGVRASRPCGPHV